MRELRRVWCLVDGQGSVGDGSFELLCLMPFRSYAAMLDATLAGQCNLGRQDQKSNSTCAPINRRQSQPIIAAMMTTR